MFPERGSLTFLTGVLIVTLSCEARGPPWVSRQVEDRQTAKLGRTVRLPCPVEGDPPPLVLWVKDGRNVNQGWSRYKVLKQSLKIKEVELEDAGVYICRVTNGFGSLALNFTLIVIDNYIAVWCSRGKATEPEQSDDQVPDDTQYSALNISNDKRESEEQSEVNPTECVYSAVKH
ncbi:fibroblast growth factor receptor-like 1b [Garra rufa]|uniref:fibroblast growth factor receptor-like 1b n=1 Tax=Garra rufa TaxID=137080 RepID=UPI003CCEA9F0